MYKKFFGLRESPFKVNPDPRYLFLTPGIQEALASLAYGIRGRRGIILLSDEVLEEIRFLTNLETSTEKLLQVVLSGQPELEEKLRQPHLRQLRQRITVRCKTSPLSLQETQGYIAERLRIAGASNVQLFSPEAIERVYRHSRGIPRVINVLCEHALINCFADQQKTVTPDHIEGVAREFELDLNTVRTTPLSSYQENLTSVEKVLRDLSSVLERMRQP